MTEATIDYSPNPCARDMTLILYEGDLKYATSSQLERFLRVWVTDRHLYAPHLETLILELQEEDTIQGIQTFLEYYANVPKGSQTTQIRRKPWTT